MCHGNEADSKEIPVNSLALSNFSFFWVGVEIPDLHFSRTVVSRSSAETRRTFSCGHGTVTMAVTMATPMVAKAREGTGAGSQ